MPGSRKSAAHRGNALQLGQGRRSKGGRRFAHKAEKKPEWDGFISDLERFKICPEEVERRRAARKSKHVVSAAAVNQSRSAPYDMDDNKPAGGRDEEENAVPQPKYPLHKDISLGLSGGRKLGDLDYRSMAKVLQAQISRSAPRVDMANNDNIQNASAGVVDFEDEVRDFILRRRSQPHASPHQSDAQPMEPISERMNPTMREPHSPKRVLESDGGESVSPKSDTGPVLGRARQESSVDAGGFGSAFFQGPAHANSGAPEELQNRVRSMEALPAQMEMMRQDMAHLKEENMQLKEEFSEFMGHTSSVLSQLQTQIQQLLTRPEGTMNQERPSRWSDSVPSVPDVADESPAEARARCFAPIPSSRQSQRAAAETVPRAKQAVDVGTRLRAMHVNDEDANLPSFSMMRSAHHSNFQVQHEPGGVFLNHGRL